MCCTFIPLCIRGFIFLILQGWIFFSNPLITKQLKVGLIAYAGCSAARAQLSIRHIVTYSKQDDLQSHKRLSGWFCTAAQPKFQFPVRVLLCTLFTAGVLMVHSSIRTYPPRSFLDMLLTLHRILGAVSCPDWAQSSIRSLICTRKASIVRSNLSTRMDGDRFFQMHGYFFPRTAFHLDLTAPGEQSCN